MSQSSRNKKAPEPVAQSVSLPGVIAALVVVGVFVVLGIMLAQPGGQQQAAAPTLAPFEVATVVPADTSAALPADVAARNGFYSAPPPMTIDPAKEYTATITTPRGDIVIRLRPDLAPIAVNNFVFLARAGFYDGVTWHRVLQGFMAQGGDPSGTGGGGPGYTIKDEFGPEMIFDRPGIVAMARTDAPDSGGSQFFITTAPAPYLNGQYTIFGEVIAGQDIVNGIPLRDPDKGATTPGEAMLKVTIMER